jgi:hypothetical protein
VKSLHRPDLFAWSTFNSERDVDFNSVLWVRPGGSVAIDPLPLSDHDRQQIESLGGIATVVVTNSDHARAATEVANAFAASVVGPAEERANFPIPCDRWVAGGEEVVPNLLALAMSGSKTPGELALVLEEGTLVTGDLVRGQRAGRLNILPDDKLTDRAAALASVRTLAALAGVSAVLVGDGFSVYRDGGMALGELAISLRP